MEKNIYKTENNVYRNWSRILHFEKHHILLNWIWPRVIFLVFHFLRFLCKNIIFRYFSTFLNFLNFGISCNNLFFLISRGHPSLKSPKECRCHVPLPCWCPGGLYCTFVTIGGPPGPKNEAKYAQTNQICLCPRSNSIGRGHPNLKSPKECLCHVHLPCRRLSGPYHTFMGIGAPLMPKKRAQIRPN